MPSRWGRSVFFLSFLTDSDCLLTEVTGIWVDCLCVVSGLRQSGLCTDVVTENDMGLKIFNFAYYRTVLAKYLKCLFYCFSKADRNEDGPLRRVVVGHGRSFLNGATLLLDVIVHSSVKP